jgi:hypothetical protein
MSTPQKPGNEAAAGHESQVPKGGDSVDCLVGPLDGTKSEGITANMGIVNYDLWTPIPLLLAQIAVNKRRAGK